MSKKEENISLFLETALKCFIKNGIYETKVKDISKAMGITERTAFRYFNSKTEMVFEALKLLWKKYLKKIERNYASLDLSNSSSLEKLQAVLMLYGNLYLTDAKQLLFVEEAEAYLTRNKINIYYQKDFPISPNNTSPLADVLKDSKVISDLNPNINLDLTYYNTFDALLGLMQKLSIEFSNKRITQEYAKERLLAITAILAQAFLK